MENGPGGMGRARIRVLPRGPASLLTPRVESGPGLQEGPPHTFQRLRWCRALWCLHFLVSLASCMPLASPHVCFAMLPACSRVWEGQGPPRAGAAPSSLCSQGLSYSVMLACPQQRFLFICLLTDLLLPHLKQYSKHLFLCFVLDHLLLHLSCL